MLENPPPPQLLPHPIDLWSGTVRQRAEGHGTPRLHGTGHSSRSLSAAPRAPRLQQRQNSPSMAGSCNGVTRRAHVGSKRADLISSHHPRAPQFPARCKGHLSSSAGARHGRRSKALRGRAGSLPARSARLCAASRHAAERISLLSGSAFACTGWLLFGSPPSRCCKGILTAAQGLRSRATHLLASLHSAGKEPK